VAFVGHVKSSEVHRLSNSIPDLFREASMQNGINVLDGDEIGEHRFDSVI
jgi:hypothetical protein